MQGAEMESLTPFENVCRKNPLAEELRKCLKVEKRTRNKSTKWPWVGKFKVSLYE